MARKPDGRRSRLDAPLPIRERPSRDGNGCCADCRTAFARQSRQFFTNFRTMPWA